MVLAYLAAARTDTSAVVPSPMPIGLGFARSRFWIKGGRDGWGVRLLNWNVVRNDWNRARTPCGLTIIFCPKLGVQAVDLLYFTFFSFGFAVQSKGEGILDALARGSIILPYQEKTYSIPADLRPPL